MITKQFYEFSNILMKADPFDFNIHYPNLKVYWNN
jgi:hypothetical protein